MRSVWTTTAADVQITADPDGKKKKSLVGREGGREGGVLGKMVQDDRAWDFASLSSTFVRDDLIRDGEAKRERGKQGISVSGGEMGGFPFLNCCEE